MARISKPDANKASPSVGRPDRFEARILDRGPRLNQPRR